MSFDSNQGIISWEQRQTQKKSSHQVLFLSERPRGCRKVFSILEICLYWNIYGFKVFESQGMIAWFPKLSKSLWLKSMIYLIINVEVDEVLCILITFALVLFRLW